jgi:hypothetical protein
LVKTLDDLNGWLLDKCVADAKTQPHPEQKNSSVFEMFEAERRFLMAYRGVCLLLESPVAASAVITLPPPNNSRWHF